MTNGAALDLSRLTILLSHERSGSHYLGSFIRALPNSRMVDEVCNEQALDPATSPLSFFGFRHRRSAEVPDYSLRRNYKVVTALLDEYFSFALAQSNGKSVTIDIKYAHVHNFEIGWWPIFRKPFFFEYIKSRKIRLIHLSRWNSLEAVISADVAESRGKWHAIGENRPATAEDAIEVNARRILDQVAMLNEQKTAFLKWSCTCNCLAITYEELADASAGAECLKQVANFLGAEFPEAFASGYTKVTPPLPQIVRNWPELANACRENGLVHYLLARHGAGAQ
jgi:hypothetical protein